MKGGWPVKPLGAVCAIARGGHPRPIQAFLTDAEDGINWVKISDATASGSTSYSTAEKIKPSGAARSRVVGDGDFLLSNSMSFGRPYIMRTTGCIHDGWLVLSAYEESFDQDFLYYLLGRLKSSGSLIVLLRVPLFGISISTLRDVFVPIPPANEQRRIVAILDEAFEGIAVAKANAERNLRNARELFESHRERVLSGEGDGWSVEPIRDLCEIRHGYAFEGEYFAAAGEFVLLTPGNFHESGGYRDRGPKQKYFVGEVPADYVLPRGELLVAMTEQAAGLLGSPLLVPESGCFLHNQRLGRVAPKPGTVWHNEFFFHVFNLRRVREQIHASASGVKVRHTSPGKIGDVCVAYPSSRDEQRRLASLLVDLNEECDQLAACVRKKLAALDELKQSLLHQAFTGAL